jgi:hypothetical protein
MMVFSSAWWASKKDAGQEAKQRRRV